MTDVTRANGKPTTRERILVAALAQFIERGVDGTTVSSIERAVGLAAGTGSFYRHFGSKEEVLVAAVEEGVARLVEEMDAARAALPVLDDPVRAPRRTTRHAWPTCGGSLRCGVSSPPSDIATRSCNGC